ncbi:hypothetical protein GCM10010267_68500 [Streptomyces griseorubens]|nr:hypothetical protein GCM10010267_68500 [Streptomyces griseorubens]
MWGRCLGSRLVVWSGGYFGAASGLDGGAGGVMELSQAVRVGEWGGTAGEGVPLVGIGVLDGDGSQPSGWRVVATARSPVMTPTSSVIAPPLSAFTRSTSRSTGPLALLSVFMRCRCPAS